MTLEQEAALIIAQQRAMGDRLCSQAGDDRPEDHLCHRTARLIEALLIDRVAAPEERANDPVPA